MQCVKEGTTRFFSLLQTVLYLKKYMYGKVYSFRCFATLLCISGNFYGGIIRKSIMIHVLFDSGYRAIYQFLAIQLRTYCRNRKRDIEKKVRFSQSLLSPRVYIYMLYNNTSIFFFNSSSQLFIGVHVIYENVKRAFNSSSR